MSDPADPYKVLEQEDVSHVVIKTRPSASPLGPHVKPITTSYTGTGSVLENKRQNVPPCLMGPEGGGECKFQYELITLSQVNSNARVCVLSLRTSLGKDVLTFHAMSEAGGWGEDRPRQQLQGNAQDCGHAPDADGSHQIYFCKDRLLEWLSGPQKGYVR